LDGFSTIKYDCHNLLVAYCLGHSVYVQVQLMYAKCVFQTKSNSKFKLYFYFENFGLL